MPVRGDEMRIVSEPLVGRPESGVARYHIHAEALHSLTDQLTVCDSLKELLSWVDV